MSCAFRLPTVTSRATRARDGRAAPKLATIAGKSRQAGMMLLEALIGIVIFSIGILALVAMQTASVNAVADAQYRVEAVNAANQLLSQIWVGVSRADAPALQASLLNFQHRPGGAPADCSFNGPDATSNIVTAWRDHLTGGGPSGRPLIPVPDATKNEMQQVAVDTGSSNRVTITVCWQAPNDTGPHRHTLVAYVN